jgi:hypothetical protein
MKIGIMVRLIKEDGGTFRVECELGGQIVFSVFENRENAAEYIKSLKLIKPILK